MTYISYIGLILYIEYVEPIMKILFGFSIIEGYWSKGHIHTICFSGFSVMLDLYVGGCQAAPGDFIFFMNSPFNKYDLYNI